MKKNEWYQIPLWLIALVLIALRMLKPGFLPERVEWLPYLLVAIVCGRNISAASPVFKPDIPDAEKENLRWNKFWMFWGILGMVLISLCFIVYMAMSFLLMLWLAATVAITIKVGCDYKKELSN